jgi:deazaflavin-dependent oxidoreductase (nitroreductase family)
MASDFNIGIIEEFRANKGKVGGQFEGMRLVLVNTIGSKSGEIRMIPLAYLPHDDRVYLAGTGGRDEKDPAWVVNLRANPEATYEIGGDPIEARATSLTGEERSAAWAHIISLIPGFEDERKKRTRDIPVFALAPR